MDSGVAQKVRNLLSQHLPPLIADSIVASGLRDLAKTGESLTEHDLPLLITKLERKIRLFANQESHARVLSALRALVVAHAATTTYVIVLKTEADVSLARVRAKALGEAFNVRSLPTHKFATIVSELARNIVDYTPGGHLELSIQRERRRLCVTALDRGTGIPNLEEILAGRYKSKTGLGRGILGVKKLADAFNLQTGATGTRFEVEEIGRAHV